MINRWVIAAAAGLVTGIAILLQMPVTTHPMPHLALAGILLASLSLFLMFAGKSNWQLAFIAFSCLGVTITSRHLDTSAPTHLQTVVDSIRDTDRVHLEGIVINPPDIREYYTIVPLSIVRLTDARGLPVSVTRGLIYARIYPSSGSVGSTIEYGDRIALHSVQLQVPAKARNPGQFDMKRFLNNQGFFASVSIREQEQVEKLGSGDGNPLIFLAELVKKNLLITIKKTLPFPESSFLGGVLLGLRSGLSSEIKDVFRAAGVSHVLAVSGLHVTIITLFFMGLLKLIRLPRASSFIVIISLLVLFTLITGARPSTVRAAIMNSVTLLFFYFRGVKLDRSLLLGISIAALYILFRNPLLLTEASFLFSFSAVLSLSLLTRPIMALCSKHLRSALRIVTFFVIMTTAGALVSIPFQKLIHSHFSLICLISLILAFLFDRLFPLRIEFRRWPLWLSTFFSAQLAIQLGMLPLTAYFFKKISVAAPLANFVAIPLIGIIVQLGLFAGILGAIPLVGSWLALCLNASNWLFIKLFLATATFFGTRFPYPDVSPPKPFFLALYYSALMILAFHTPFRSAVFPRVRYIAAHWRKTSILCRLLAVTCALILFVPGLIDSLKQDFPRCIITFLDPTIGFAGGGNAVIIQTPDNKAFLVDAGPRYVLQRNEPVIVDIGSRVVVPALMALHSRHLNGIVATSADGLNAGGIASIIENPWIQVDRLYHALPFETLEQDENTDDILKLMQDPELFQGNYRRRSELTAWAIRDMFRAARIKAISMETIRAGDLLQESEICHGGHRVPFRIRVLNPPEKLTSGPFSSRTNSVVLGVEYGDVRIHLTSNSGRNTLGDIAIREQTSPHLVQLASNGADFAIHQDYLKGASAAIAVPLPSRWALKDIEHTGELLRSMGIEFFSVSDNGAITVSTNGRDLWIRPMNEQERRIRIP